LAHRAIDECQRDEREVSGISVTTRVPDRIGDISGNALGVEFESKDIHANSETYDCR
jgi:hypothetical protein